MGAKIPGDTKKAGFKPAFFSYSDIFPPGSRIAKFGIRIFSSVPSRLASLQEIFRFLLGVQYAFCG
jgi:hypothetical protein